MLADNRFAEAELGGGFREGAAFHDFREYRHAVEVA
jgi:hypothetical protein